MQKLCVFEVYAWKFKYIYNSLYFNYKRLDSNKKKIKTQLDSFFFFLIRIKKNLKLNPKKYNLKNLNLLKSGHG
jgi:hypothetical protein